MHTLCPCRCLSWAETGGLSHRPVDREAADSPGRRPGQPQMHVRLFSAIRAAGHDVGKDPEPGSLSPSTWRPASPATQQDPWGCSGLGMVVVRFSPVCPSACYTGRTGQGWPVSPRAGLQGKMFWGDSSSFILIKSIAYFYKNLTNKGWKHCRRFELSLGLTSPVWTHPTRSACKRAPILSVVAETDRTMLTEHVG